MSQAFKLGRPNCLAISKADMVKAANNIFQGEGGMGQRGNSKAIN